MIPPILARRSAADFWLAVLLTGIGTGLAAAALTALLELTQHHIWGGNGARPAARRVARLAHAPPRSS